MAHRSSSIACRALMPRGHAGLEDKVNWHWDRIFAGAAVSTLVGVAAALATPNRSASGNGTVVIATQQSVQDSV